MQYLYCLFQLAIINNTAHANSRKEKNSEVRFIGSPKLVRHPSSKNLMKILISQTALQL